MVVARRARTPGRVQGANTELRRMRDRPVDGDRRSLGCRAVVVQIGEGLIDSRGCSRDSSRSSKDNSRGSSSDLTHASSVGDSISLTLVIVVGDDVTVADNLGTIELRVL